MHLEDLCTHLRNHRLLLIARGRIHEPARPPFLAMVGIDEEARPATPAMEQAIAEHQSALYVLALCHDSRLCPEPDTHRLAWTQQDGMVCVACRQRRDRYWREAAHTPPGQVRDLRPRPQGKILSFVSKARPG